MEVSYKSCLPFFYVLLPYRFLQIPGILMPILLSSSIPSLSRRIVPTSNVDVHVLAQVLEGGERRGEWDLDVYGSPQSCTHVGWA